MTFLPDERGRGGEKLGLSGGRVGGKSMMLSCNLYCSYQRQKNDGLSTTAICTKEWNFFYYQRIFLTD